MYIYVVCTIKKHKSETTQSKKDTQKWKIPRDEIQKKIFSILTKFMSKEK